MSPGPGLDEPLLAVKRNGSGTQLWLPVVSDGQGQLIAIADSGGQLNGALLGPQYDAGLWNSSGLTSNSHSFNPRRWATQGQVDTISTFRARQYDPATGKWLQEDPIGIAGGVNLYDYNGNDPNSFSDPFGLQCPACIALEAGAELIPGAQPVVTPLILLTGAASIGMALGSIPAGHRPGARLTHTVTDATAAHPVEMASAQTWLRRLPVAGAIRAGGGLPARVKGSEQPPEVEQPAKPDRPDEKSPTKKRDHP